MITPLFSSAKHFQQFDSFWQGRQRALEGRSRKNCRIAAVHGNNFLYLTVIILKSLPLSDDGYSVSMKALFIIICLFLVGPVYAGGKILAESCDLFANGNAGESAKCLAFVKQNEVSFETVKACTRFSSDNRVRWSCLSIHPEFTTADLCAATSWSMENKVSCLRYNPTRKHMQACADLSKNAEAVFTCVKAGREPFQIEACANISVVDSDKLNCLKFEYPPLVVNRCIQGNSAMAARKDCLKNYELEINRVAQEDRKEVKKDVHKETQRDIASEKEKLP